MKLSTRQAKYKLRITNYCSSIIAGATIRRTRRLPWALGQRGQQKGPENATVWFRMLRTYTK